LYIDVPAKARNDWWPTLEMEPFESYVRDKIGAIVHPDSLVAVPDEIMQLLENPAAFRESVAKLREEWVFNLGSSAQAGAKAIAELAAQADARPQQTAGS
jgi:YidC/Oxa1 family membrane protein insertase